MNNLTHCGTIEIATERLYLKRIEKYDATSMYSNFAGDDRVSQYMSWDSFKTVEDVEKCIDEWQEEYKKDDTYYWGISHPLLTKEFLYSWFDGFKNFDVNKLKNRKMLIDTFVNSIVLYDDRIDFYFNFKDNAKSLALSELNTVSDLSSSSPTRMIAVIDIISITASVLFMLQRFKYQKL